MTAPILSAAAAGHEPGVEYRFLVIQQRSTVPIGQSSTGRNQNTVCGSRIPLTGGPQPGINISLAFRNDADFQRAAHTATQTYTGNQDQASVNQVARVLMDHIAREIRSTEDVHLYSHGIGLIYPTGGTVSEAIYASYENQLYVQRTLADGSVTNAVLMGSDQGFVVTDMETEAYYQNVWIEDASGAVVSVSRPRLVSVKLSFRLAGQTTVQSVSLSPYWASCFFCEPSSRKSE